MFHSISHQPGRVTGSHLVRLVWKDQAVILKSLNPIFVPDNSARDNPNTSANPQHLALLPVLLGILPLPGLPPFPFDLGHNFGETVRFWVFARTKGPHVHVSVHTELYYSFTFHSSQVPQGLSPLPAASSPQAFLQYTQETYPPILSHTCIHLLINIMLINIIRREPKY